MILIKENLRESLKIAPWEKLVTPLKRCIGPTASGPDAPIYEL